MMDTITAHRRSQSQTRSHLSAEWRDKRDALNAVVRHATALVSALQDVPKPLFVAEAKIHQDASETFATHVGEALGDYLGNMLGNLKREYDDVGGNPDDIAIDLSHFEAAREAVEQRRGA